MVERSWGLFVRLREGLVDSWEVGICLGFGLGRRHCELLPCDSGIRQIWLVRKTLQPPAAFCLSLLHGTNSGRSASHEVQRGGLQ